MKHKIEWLVGRWEPADESSAVVLEILRTARGLKVRAFNQDDGEEYIVSKTKWNGKNLRFEITVPSNKWRTRNCLTPISRCKFVQEITFWELWKKRSVPVSTHKRRDVP